MNQDYIYSLFKLIIERNRLVRQRHNAISQRLRVRKAMNTVWQVNTVYEINGNIHRSTHLICRTKKEAEGFMREKYSNIKLIPSREGCVNRTYEAVDQWDHNVTIHLERIHTNIVDKELNKVLVKKTLQWNKALDELHAFTKRTLKLRRKLGRELRTRQVTDDRGVVNAVYLNLASKKEYPDLQAVKQRAPSEDKYDEWKRLLKKYNLMPIYNGYCTEESKYYTESDMLYFIANYEAERALLG